MSTYADYALWVSKRCTRMDWMSNNQVRVHQYSIRNFSIYTFLYAKCLQCVKRCFLVSVIAVSAIFECQCSSDKIAHWHAENRCWKYVCCGRWRRRWPCVCQKFFIFTYFLGSDKFVAQWRRSTVVYFKINNLLHLVNKETSTKN